MPLRMVYRENWGARSPKGTRYLNLPVENIIVWYFTDIPYCKTDDDCARTVNELQRRDLDQGLDDIRYNFIVGGNGDTYEGRGWFLHSASRLPYSRFHGNRIDIAYVGNFRGKNVLPFEMLDAQMNLVELGVQKKYLVKNYYLLEEERKFL